MEFTVQHEANILRHADHQYFVCYLALSLHALSTIVLCYLACQFCTISSTQLGILGCVNIASLSTVLTNPPTKVFALLATECTIPSQYLHRLAGRIQATTKQPLINSRTYLTR